MQPLIRFTIAMLCLLLFTRANATNLDNKLDGVWQGTLGNNQLGINQSANKQSGNKKIVACFKVSAADTLGSYYELPTNFSVYVTGKNSDGFLQEDTDDKSDESSIFNWQFDYVSKGYIRGKRFNLKTNIVEYFNLRRAKKIKPYNKDYNLNSTDCDQASYDQPRVNALLKQAKSRQYQFNQNTYQKLSINSTKFSFKLNTVQLNSKTPAMRRINGQLKKDFERDLSFDFSANDQYGTRSGHIESTKTISYWGENWISFHDTDDSYTGGAHGSNTQDYTTYSTQTGNIEDINLWFKKDYYEDKLNEYAETGEPSVIKKYVCKLQYENNCKNMLVDKLVRDKTCQANKSKPRCTFDDKDDNLIGYLIVGGLRPAGIVFINQFDSATGSSYGIVIPYKKIMPFLNQTGKAHVKAIMNAQPKS